MRGNSAHGNRSVTAVILVLEIIELSVFIYVCFKDADGAGSLDLLYLAVDTETHFRSCENIFTSCATWWLRRTGKSADSIFTLRSMGGPCVIEFNPARRWLSKFLLWPTQSNATKEVWLYWPGALADSIFLLCPCKGASTVKPRAHFTVQNLVVEKWNMAPWILATARMPQTACTTRPNRWDHQKIWTRVGRL